MTGLVQKIIAGAALPKSFAVIESTGYPQALRDVREAFANPETHLVIWNKSADLISKGFQ
jgi:hypothetical protein